MKKLFFILLFVPAIVMGYQDQFCDGYEAGYKAGWCYGKYSCLEPLTPLCPLARLGEDSFEGGYNRGFLDGLNAR